MEGARYVNRHRRCEIIDGRMVTPIRVSAGCREAGSVGGSEVNTLINPLSPTPMRGKYQIGIWNDRGGLAD